MTKCDVAIVGAGPSGSYLAYRLARQGLNVHVLEEHATIGEPRHCTGVLGREAYDRFPDLPRQMIQAELRAAWIVSPSGERVRTVWFEKGAYVIQRAQFDRALAHMAEEAGARIRTSSTVRTVQVKADNALLTIAHATEGETTLEAKLVVIASGISYRLHGHVGLVPPAAHLQCAQLETNARDLSDVEVYIGRRIAPGSFAWAVPIGNGRVRLGVTAHQKAAMHLENLMASSLLKDRLDRNGESIVKRSIPIRPVDCSVSDRVLLVGDAAGHVKPTTGGGIFYGLIGVSEAAITIRHAFAKNRFDTSFLMEYEASWRKHLRRELWMGRISRRIFESLSDARLDRLVNVCHQRSVTNAIQETADFDWHAKTVFSFITSPRVLSQMI